MQRAELHCPADATSVGLARRFVRETLAGWDLTDYEWSAVAIVSELSTNAVLHARTDFTVVISLTDHGLRLAVRDGSPLPPVKRRFGRSSTTGRGMKLVDELSQRWDVEHHGEFKIVWADLLSDVDGSRVHEVIEAGTDVEMPDRLGGDDARENARHPRARLEASAA